MKRTNAIALASLTILLNSCAYWKLLTTQPTIVQDQTTGQYHFAGPINFGTAQKLSSLVPAGSTVVIESVGGRSEEAMQMARWAKLNSVSLVIDGFCASACANYLAAVPGVRVVSPSLLAFHGSRLGEFVAINTNFLKNCGGIEKCRSSVDALTLPELQFFDQFGLNPEFMGFSQKASQYVKTQKSATDGKTSYIGLGFPYFWVPTSQELKCYGLSLPVTPLKDFQIKDKDRKSFFTTVELPEDLQTELKNICESWRTEHPI